MEDDTHTHYENPAQESPAKKQRYKRESTGVAWGVEWVIIPGAIGIGMTLLLVRILAAFVNAFSSRLDIGYALSRAFREIGADIKATFSGDFSSNMWLILLFGVLVGTFVKYTFSDSRD